MNFTGFLWLLIGMKLVAAQSFRSILIERACAKKPDLSFCADFVPTTTTTTTTTTAIRLVLPPNPSGAPAMIEPTMTTAAAAVVASTTSKEDSVVFDEKDENSTLTRKEEPETLGSLVRLPKPLKSDSEIAADHVLMKADGDEEKMLNNGSSTVSIEDEKGVLVFVSEYCVIEREHFVKNCNGEIEKNEISFCKTYPSACVSTNGVIPVISYCQRYYKHYPKHCTKQLVAPEALQFCFAFEQFCLPELHAATMTKSNENVKSSLRKCEDVLPEARKVCNPFPNPKDTFNLLRCTQFLTNCKKFVDWL